MPSGKELRRLRKRLRVQGEQDRLTGLCSRQRFNSETESHLDQVARHRRPGALLLIDIDAFHFVNDSLGHESGDRLLRKVAAILNQEARSSDTLARMCGDEFALLLREAEREEAVAVAQRLIAAIKDRSEPSVGVSIGIATFGGNAEGVTASDLLVGADIALYSAKEEGGGRAVVHTGQRGESLTWVECIREAIEEQRIIVHAQPILDLGSRKVVRDELLVRMLDPQDDVIPPASFLPTAERFGLIADIDRMVIAKAIELAGRSRPISVNVSGGSFSDPRLIDDVEEAITGGLNPAWLGFEITETAAVSNMTDAEIFAKSVTNLGCQLGLDDFGTGFSSFNYLKHLPIQYVKIDIDFIRDLRGSAVDQRLVDAMVQIANAFGQQTVAEGVEDSDTLTLVQALGVDYAQGFHIGHPMLVA